MKCRVESDLREYERNQERIERNYEITLSDRLDEIMQAGTELLLDADLMINKGYCENYQRDVIEFFSSYYLDKKTKLSDLPESFVIELFQQVCDDLGYNFDNYKEEILKWRKD